MNLEKLKKYRWELKYDSFGGKDKYYTMDIFDEIEKVFSCYADTETHLNQLLDDFLK